MQAKKGLGKNISRLANYHIITLTMSDKKYWTSFAALNNKEEIQKLTQNEFNEDLPFEDLDDKGILDAKHPRRDFLKYLGFSTAAATLAASCKTPVRKAIPFVNRAENTLPGVATKTPLSLRHAHIVLHARMVYWLSF